MGAIMAKLTYTAEEILADHPYATPQVEAGFKLHGGFDADGNYIPPRTLNRWPAVKAWEAALLERGGDLLDASGDLLERENYPNADQAAFLISRGDGQTLWNQLTHTGIIEARGGVLRDVVAPDFQDIIEEDITEWATAHLNKGLMRAHGMDEAGDPDAGVGGHDDMWFAVRDMLFGKGKYPLTEPEDSIGKPDPGVQMPQIPPQYEGLIRVFMDVLLIEVRAEAFFSYCERIMRNPTLFTDRREDADHAATLVNRIRSDEEVHVGYLRVVLSELRNATFKCLDGSTVKGAELMDPMWEQMVTWHGRTVFDLRRDDTRQMIHDRLATSDDAAEAISKFDSLETKLKAA